MSGIEVAALLWAIFGPVAILCLTLWINWYISTHNNLIIYNGMSCRLDEIKEFFSLMNPEIQYDMTTENANTNVELINKGSNIIIKGGTIKLSRFDIALALDSHDENSYWYTQSMGLMKVNSYLPYQWEIRQKVIKYFDTLELLNIGGYAALPSWAKNYTYVVCNNSSLATSLHTLFVWRMITRNRGGRIEVLRSMILVRDYKLIGDWAKLFIELSKKEKQSEAVKALQVHLLRYVDSTARALADSPDATKFISGLLDYLDMAKC